MQYTTVSVKVTPKMYQIRYQTGDSVYFRRVPKTPNPVTVRDGHLTLNIYPVNDSRGTRYVCTVAQPENIVQWCVWESK